MKLKALSVFMTAVIILTTLLIGCSSCDSTPDKVYELTYSNFFPSTHYNSILAQQWIEEVESRSKGAVKITYLPGGTLATGAKTYDAVVQGICDIGMSVLSYTPGRFPASELVDMPHSYPSGWVATQVANDFYNEFKPAEFNDTHILYFHAHGPGVLFMAEEPVRTLEDLQGKIIRGTGIGVEIVKALGAQGTGESQSQAFELLQKKIIDGSFAPRETLKGWSQGPVVQYVTACTDVGNTSMMFVTINKDKWNSLPSNIQKIFTDVSREWAEKHGKVWNYYDRVAIEYFLGLGGGREVITLSNDEMAKWVNATKPLLEKAITDRNAQGLSATDMDEYIKERVIYWSSRAPGDADVTSFVESEVINWTPTK